MSARNRIGRVRLSYPLQWVGLLLAAAGLSAVGLENISSGHVHLACEHAVHHRHLYSGPHEHAAADHDQDRDHDQDHDHDHETPDAPHGPAPSRRTATFSAAPALFQPLAASVLVAPLVESTSLVLRPALLRVARPVARLIPPRAPPFSIAGPDSSI